MAVSRRGLVLGAGLMVLGGGAASVLCCGGSTPEPEAAPASADPAAGGPRRADPTQGGSGGPLHGASHEDASTRGADACESGPVLVSVRRRPLGGGGDPEATIVVFQGGAYEVQRAGESARRCLSQADQEALSGLVAAADFAPPPPPEMRCMAMPTMETTVEHPASGRSAQFVTPCGDPPHPSVVQIVMLVLGLEPSR